MEGHSHVVHLLLHGYQGRVRSRNKLLLIRICNLYVVLSSNFLSSPIIFSLCVYLFPILSIFPYVFRFFLVQTSQPHDAILQAAVHGRLELVRELAEIEDVLLETSSNCAFDASTGDSVSTLLSRSRIQELELTSLRSDVLGHVLFHAVEAAQWSVARLLLDLGASATHRRIQLDPVCYFSLCVH